MLKKYSKNSHFVIYSNLISAVMIDHVFDILCQWRFGRECENSRRHFRSLKPTIFDTDLRKLSGFPLPEAGWRGTRATGRKWTKFRRLLARLAIELARLVFLFFFCTGTPAASDSKPHKIAKDHTEDIR